jgi:SAM-dependent methyltransferase
VIFITIISFFITDIAAMNKTFWDNRYAQNETVYGRKPNRFFKSFIDSHKSGSILLPAEGEGRNAIYAARRGWQVDAFDFSDEAQKKAMYLAEQSKVHIDYQIAEIKNFRAVKKYDAVSLIYVHLPVGIRENFHREIYDSLRSGGYLVFEAFAKEQIHFTSGGPKELSLLYDAPTVCNDFPFLHIISCGQKEIEMDEGVFHKGKGAVLQLLGQKL